MKSDFFARRALLILCVLFFLIPFAMRGARMSWERMENNVKDWLPGTLEETQELAWFGQHFVNEQSSVVLTWEGCSEKDESYRLFLEKLRKEIKPENEELIGDEPFVADSTAADGEADADRSQQRARELMRGRQLGDQLGLYATGDYYTNWGGLNEKWLRGTGQAWYYITPKGELYRWNGSSHVLGALTRLFQRKVLGSTTLDATLVARLGAPPAGGKTNGFHDDPQRLVARVLRSVATGPEVLATLTAPGGVLWPTGGEITDAERAQIARRKALDRLSGTFFGPEPYVQFAWTADDLPRLLRPATMRQLPRDWRTTVDAFIKNLVRTEYADQRSELIAESVLKKEQHWNAMFAALQVEPPGLQTCILVTLSDPGMKDLDRVLGRGLFGQPRGKLVSLAEESGVSAPPEPSVFALGPAPLAVEKVLRMGGPAADNVAFDEEGQMTLVRLAMSLALLGVILGFVCFQRLTAVLMILLVGIVSALASLAIVWWTRSYVDAVLWLMPPLVFVLGMVGAIYMLSAYRKTVRERGLEGAPSRALAYAAPPCILATTTLALGLFALCTSADYPVRKFGFFSALGVLATLVVLFTFLPSALQLWPLNWQRSRRQDSPSHAARIGGWCWQSIGNLAVAHSWWVAISAVSLMVLLGVNLGQLKTSVQPLTLFRADTKVIRDYRWLEDHVGKPVPMELVIAVDRKCQLPAAETSLETPPLTPAEAVEREYQHSLLERIELVAHVQDAIDRVFGPRGQDLLGPALSAATFAPPLLDPLDEGREAMNADLERNASQLRRAGYLAFADDGSELWRINVRLSALGDVDHGRFIAQLKQVVEPVLTAYEVRDEILRKIAEQHPDASDPQDRWNNTRIAILGAPDPRDEAGDITATVELPQVTSSVTRGSASAALEDDNQTLGVHREFSRVLGDLLRAKGYEVGRKGGRNPSSRLIAWQDPRRNPLRDNARSDAWAKQLASLDCVVVLRDHPDYDMDFIRQHAKCVVDARDHGFDPIQAKTARQLAKPIGVIYTGTVPILHRAEQTLLQSVLDTSWWSFVAIAVVMMLCLRTRTLQLLNVRGGLTAMLPAIFVVVVVFGEIASEGLLVDIGTVMTAGVAISVTAIGTFQFLSALRRTIREGQTRPTAIKVAFGRSSLSILQTTVIGGLGISLFALGTFVPIQWFGITMLAHLGTALVANLVLLPALVAGPLGRYLCPEVPGIAAETEGEACLPLSQEMAGSAAVLRSAAREGHMATVMRRDGSHS